MAATTPLIKRPFCRASDCLAFIGLEQVGETASVCKAPWNVAVKRSIAPKLVADALLRIEDKNWHADAIAYGLHDWRKVGVAGDEDEAVGAPLVCVSEHCRGDVHVRHLLRYAKHFDASVFASLVAGSTWFACGGKKFALFTIMPFDDFHEWTAGESVEILVLSLGASMLWGFVDYARSKIPDGDNCMVRIKEFGGERLKIEPLVGSASKLPVIKIAPVYVNDRAFHSPPLKVQGPGTRPALRRLPESRRVKNPVIGGSAYYTKFLDAA